LNPRLAGQSCLVVLTGLFSLAVVPTFAMAWSWHVAARRLLD
jgi:hypothetical protein